MKLYRKDIDYPALYEIVLTMVRKTLREDWDPLGVAADYPTCYDEYDSYAPGLATMLMHAVGSDGWTARRQEIMQHMGLVDSDEEAAAIGVFELLRKRAEQTASSFYD